MSLDVLSRLYPDPDDPLRITAGGLWHATPLPVLAAAVPRVEALLFPAGRPHVLFDAGAGDGRVLAALALGLSATLDVTLLGLECAGPLVERARAAIAALELETSRRPRVEEGSYFERNDYERLGITPGSLALVFNYPDGNEVRLLRFLDAHGGKGTRLLVLSPERSPALDREPLHREAVPSAEGASWSLSLFGLC